MAHKITLMHRLRGAKIPFILLALTASSCGALAAPSRGNDSGSQGKRLGRAAASPSKHVSRKTGKAWSYDLSAGQLWESNYNYMPRSLAASGRALGLGIHYQGDLGRRRKFTLDGAFKDYRYTDHSRLNRQFNEITASYEQPLAGRIHTETTWKQFKNGATADHKLIDNTSFRERLSYRFSRGSRAYLELGRLEKHYPDFGTHDSTDPFYGCGLSLKIAKRDRLDLGFDYTENHPSRLSLQYLRRNYTVSFLHSFGSRDKLTLGYKYEDRRYDKTIRIGGVKVPRQDYRHGLSVEWRRELTPNLDMTALYRREERTSNRKLRNLNAETLMETLTYHW